MAVLSQAELMEQIKGVLGDKNDDASIKFLEDVTDTLNDMSSKTSGTDDWKAKYEENDKMWREKYTSRFFSQAPEQPTGQSTLESIAQPPEPDTEPHSFEDLFTDVK